MCIKLFAVYYLSTICSFIGIFKAVMCSIILKAVNLSVRRIQSRIFIGTDAVKNLSFFTGDSYDRKRCIFRLDSFLKNMLLQVS